MLQITLHTAHDNRPRRVHALRGRCRMLFGISEPLASMLNRYSLQPVRQG